MKFVGCILRGAIVRQLVKIASMTLIVSYTDCALLTIIFSVSISGFTLNSCSTVVGSVPVLRDLCTKILRQSERKMCIICTGLFISERC